MLRKDIPLFFKARRDRLMKTHPGAAFVFPATPIHMRNPDVDYPFRQESNFFYLSAFEEPESWLVLAPQTSSPGAYKAVLFVQERNVEMELWEGERYGADRAKSWFHVDEAYVNTELDAKLPELLKSSDRVYYAAGMYPEYDERLYRALAKVRRAHGRSGRGQLPIHDPKEPLGEMRLFKTAEEVEYLRKACKISSLAHAAVMKEARPGWNEAEVEALIDYTLRRNGCARVGYGSIVAGGKNATCLHYRANNEPLREGDLLLIDAGGEYEYYTSDITRTWPVGRTFTLEQEKVYDLVLRAQKETLAILKPGLEYAEIHKKATEVLVEGLLSMGHLKGDTKSIIANGLQRQFYPHGTGHYLGMDVHDIGLYGEGSRRKLEAGMCFTVEPGLYYQPGDAQAPEAFRGIGVRIEDNILITANGYENLTADCPKEKSDILALRK
jgi:Xaa-Pro aminopeptidase